MVSGVGDGQLIVERFGAFLGKHSERVRVSVKGEIVEERPLYGLEHVYILSGGVSLSSDLIRECAERGIMLTFLSGTGEPYAQVVSPDLTGTVRTRREQLLAYLDGRGVAAARAFASGKMHNQAALLKYMAKYRKGRSPDLYERARLEAEEVYEGRRQKLRNILQGQARRLAAFLRREAATYQPFVGRW
jgi:CRISPR-associated protein Cas1